MKAMLQNHLPGEYPQTTPQRIAAVCTPTRFVPIDQVRVIGERINPTGKKRFAQALRDGDMDYIVAQGVEQVARGAEILDVNVGVPGIDEPAVMAQVVDALQAVVNGRCRSIPPTRWLLRRAFATARARRSSIRSTARRGGCAHPAAGQEVRSGRGGTDDGRARPAPDRAERFAVAERIVARAAALASRKGTSTSTA